MLEYVLFHQTPLELFVAFLKQNGVEAQTSEEEGIYEIKIPEDLDDALLEAIETRYDELMDMKPGALLSRKCPIGRKLPHGVPDHHPQKRQNHHGPYPPRVTIAGA